MGLEILIYTLLGLVCLLQFLDVQVIKIYVMAFYLD